MNNLSKNISFPEVKRCREVVFAENDFQLIKSWQLDNANVREDDNTGLFIADLYDAEGKWSKYDTILSPDGTYLTTEVFENLEEFHNGMATINPAGKGYGYINSDGKVIHPPVYERALDFSRGYAFAVKNGKEYLLDKKGNELPLPEKYKLFGSMCDGMLPVSTLLMPPVELSLWSDEVFLAGTWGYIDETGKEVISPQYIYADSFEDGLAIVCKGKWEKRSDDSYWSNEQLWGVIDVNGKEIIPCQYDEIEVFDNTFKVCSDGKFGVMDRKGKWLVQPQFNSLGDEYHDGLVIFYDTRQWEEGGLCGIYDVNAQKVLFEPQFDNIAFIEKDLFIVTKTDSCDHFTIHIIDRSGKEIFPSDYNFIRQHGGYYEVGRCCDGKILWGLLDSNGSVILPCKYEQQPWNGISVENGNMIVAADKFSGVIDFSENQLIRAEYQHLIRLNKQWFCFKKDDFCGIISVSGKIVLPGKYANIRLCRNNRIIASTKNHTDVFEIIHNK